MQFKGEIVTQPHHKVHLMGKSKVCMLHVNPWNYLRVGYHGQFSCHVKRFIPFIRSTVGYTIYSMREDCRSSTKHRRVECKAVKYLLLGLGEWDCESSCSL